MDAAPNIAEYEALRAENAVLRKELVEHDVNPHAWLSDVLARIPTHPQKLVEELLPHYWKERKG